jgi:hypothetical protein
MNGRKIAGRSGVKTFDAVPTRVQGPVNALGEPKRKVPALSGGDFISMQSDGQ